MLEADVEVDRPDFAVRARLTVAPGERLALFGPSGAGKTTLLELIAGLVTPRRARITLAGRVLTSTAASGTGARVTAVPPHLRRIGLLRQDPGLFPHLSVRENLRYARRDAAAAAELAELAEVLGIDGLLAVMPSKLSGGQAHRVALGRLLLSHCDALLLDEPYTGLDAGLRRTLTDLVVALVGQRGIPAVLVAHELAEAQAFADRLAVLDRGEILQSGPPGEVVTRPALRRVAELVGYGGFIPAAGTAGGSGGSPPRAGTVAGIHPERVIRGGHDDRGLVLAGVVTACRPAGALWELTVSVGGGTLTARLPEASPVGEQVTLTAVDPPWFGEDGTAVAVGPPAGRAADDAGRDGAGRDGAGRDRAGRTGAQR